MAIGIDKLLHIRLLDGLRELADREQGAYWTCLLGELEQMYEQTGQLQRLAEKTACMYNELQAKVRTEVAKEQRSRKRRHRITI